MAKIAAKIYDNKFYFHGQTAKEESDVNNFLLFALPRTVFARIKFPNGHQPSPFYYSLRKTANLFFFLAFRC